MKRKFFLSLIACLLSVFMGGSLAFAQDLPNVDQEVTNQYITNADLSAGTGGWNVSNFNAPKKQNDCYASEAYAGWGSLDVKSYGLTQEITLSKGRYRLVNYSFFRQGQDVNTDATKSLCNLVAGDSKVLIKTLGYQTFMNYPNSQAGENSNDHIAKTNGGAGFFAQKIYENEIVFEVTADEETLTIGLEGTFDQEKSWCIAGPFHLYKVGKAKYDLTSLVKNNGFENGLNDWQTEGEWGLQTNLESVKSGIRYAEKWQSSGGLPNGKIYQTLNDMPVGYYKLTASTNSTGIGTYLYINNARTEANGAAVVSVETEVADGTLEFGYVRDNTTANWVAIDNVQLYYLGNATEAVAKVYNEVKAKVDLLDAAGQAKFADLTATIKAAIDAETVTSAQKDGYIADIQAAYVTSVKVQTTPGSDWTDAIVNPSFEDDLAGWTNTDMAPQGNNSFDKTGAKYAEAWQPNGTRSVGQTITDLPEGVYTITVHAKARGLASASLYAGDSSAAMTIDDNARDYSVTLATSGNLAIGATAVGTGANTSWFCLDNFRLTYVGSVADYLTSALAAATVDTSKPMNAETKTAYETALATANTAKASGTPAEKYAAAQALDAATSAANASIAAYTNVKTLLDELETTNIYPAATAAEIAALKSSYEAATLTDEDASAIKLGGGWHAANNYDDYILPAWKIGGEQCNEYDKVLYLNTWSTEGKTDGSDVTTPFFEYWVADKEVLGANTITATQAGLTAGKMYQVSALVRVHATNGQTAAANGITLQVGDGKAVDICHGAALANNYNYGTYTAVGAADEDGVLTIKFNVNEGCNVSWLAYKNVFYAEAVAADLTALDDAIAAAEAKTLGFEAGEYAPYNNVAVLQTLAAAKAVNGYEPQAEIDALTAALTGATWTANTAEVNAIYDGDFTEYAYAETGANEQAFAWTGDAGHNDATNVRHQYDKTANPGLEASAGEALFIKFGASYGLTEGYTMPLKANTAYKLTFIYGGWGENDGQIRDNVGKDVNVTAPNGDVIALTPDHIQANKNGHSTPSTWKSYTGVFTTDEAGDYVLNFVHKTANNLQDQYVFSNFNLVKAPEATATMSITAAKYATFIAPFAVEIPSGVTASTVTGVEDKVLVLDDLDGTIPANTPVILYSEEPVAKAVSGQSLAVKSEYTVGLLTGVYESAAAPVGSYVLQNQSGKVGFYVVADGKQPTVGANRAYLNVPAASAKAYFFADDATGVSSAAVADEKVADGKYVAEGKLVIVKGGKKYTAAGVEVK